MGEDPRDVEQRIENTRERMGDTVEALSAKADVPGRVKGYMEDKKDAVTSKVSDAKEKVTGAAGSVGDNGSHAAGQAAQAARKSAGIAKENPLGLASRFAEVRLEVAGVLFAGFLRGFGCGLRGVVCELFAVFDGLASDFPCLVLHLVRQRPEVFVLDPACGKPHAVQESSATRATPPLRLVANNLRTEVVPLAHRGPQTCRGCEIDDVKAGAAQAAPVR